MKKLLSTMIALVMLSSIIGIMPASASGKFQDIELAITGTSSNGLPVGKTIQSPNAAFSVKCLDKNGYEWEVIYSQYVTYWQDSAGTKITTGKNVEANSYYTLNIGVQPIDDDSGEDDVDINQVKSITLNGVPLTTSQYRRGELGTSIYITAKFCYANVTDATGAGYYFPGETVAVKANNAPSGQHFKGWNGAYGAGGKYRFELDFKNESASSTTFKMPATSFNYVKPAYENHTPVTVKGTAATCTADGKTDGSKCSVCGKILTAQKTILATGHKYATTWTTDKAATCTAEGSKSHHCTVCGAKKDVTVIPKLDHKFGDWTTTKDETCDEAGTQLRKCSTCGTIETRSIPATGHDYTETVVKPTYFADGYTLHKCSICGDSYKFNTKPKLVLGNVTGFKVSSTNASAIKLTWNKVSGASGYVIYQAKNGKWVKIKTTTSTSYTVSKLQSGTSYKFAVKAYKTVSGKNCYSPKYPTVSSSTNPATVKFTLTAGSKKATVKWSKVTGATGYKIYYKTSKNGSWKSLKTVNNKTTSYTKSGLAKGKTYYFTVKAYRTTGGKTYNGTFVTKSVKVK